MDAIVVGSGANGGVAAMELTRAGLKVLVLEAGPLFEAGEAWGDPVTNLARQLWQRWVTGAQKVQERHGGYWETNPALYADDREHPYSTPEGRPYRWIHARQVGGRSMTWGGVLLRFSDYEFKAASRDGHGVDWPLSYSELAPHYDRLESFFGAWGSREGLEQLPDGVYQGTRPFSPGELVFKEKVEAEFGRRVIISRGIDARRAPEPGGGYSKLSSPGTTLAAAQATGRLTLRSDAIVSRLLTDPKTGAVVGVEYLDRITHFPHAAHAPVVFLCAGTVDSLRILLHSRCAHHPDGLGASSGWLGRGVMDHLVSNTYFVLPELADVDGHELLGSAAMLMPRWQNLGGARADHLRGYGLWGGIQRLKVPGLLRKTGQLATGFLSAMAETLSDADNRVTLDPTLTDAWGIPAPHLSCAWTDNDRKVGALMQRETASMIAAAGGVVTPLTGMMHSPLMEGFMKTMEEEWRLTSPGLFVHEVGGARMGSEPASSVVNPWGQLWDSPNVFVTDGACWVSSGWANPTLTQMAITARGAARAVEGLKRRDL